MHLQSIFTKQYHHICDIIKLPCTNFLQYACLLCRVVKMWDIHLQEELQHIQSQFQDPDTAQPTHHIDEYDSMLWNLQLSMRYEFFFVASKLAGWFLCLVCGHRDLGSLFLLRFPHARRPSLAIHSGSHVMCICVRMCVRRCVRMYVNVFVCVCACFQLSCSSWVCTRASGWCQLVD